MTKAWSFEDSHLYLGNEWTKPEDKREAVTCSHVYPLCSVRNLAEYRENDFVSTSVGSGYIAKYPFHIVPFPILIPQLSSSLK